MLKKYPNELLERLRACGLNLGDFRTQQENVQGRLVFSIRFRESPLAFRFWADGAATFSYSCCSYASTYLGGLPEAEFKEDDDRLRPFPRIQFVYDAWLESVRNLITDEAVVAEDGAMPDLWAELALPISDSGASVVLENAPFSDEETDRLTASLREFQRRVESLHLLSATQLTALGEKIDDLVEESKRPGLGRRDWLAAAAGSLIGYVIQAGLGSEAARHVLRLAGETLRWIAQTPFLLGG